MDEKILKLILGKKIIDFVLKETNSDLNMYILCEDDVLIYVEADLWGECSSSDIINKEYEYYQTYYERYLETKRELSN